MNSTLPMRALLCIIAVMAVTNMLGIRAMLSSASDISKIPVVQLIASVAGQDSTMLGPGYRLQPALVSQLMVHGNGYVLQLLPSPTPIKGHIDRLRLTNGNRAEVRGWSTPADPSRNSAFVGVWLDNRAVAVEIPQHPRPDVDRVLGRPTGKSGFALEFASTEAQLCKVGVFVIDDLMRIYWLREPLAGC